MRIISNFRDYYDNVQAYGQDQTCVYTRIPTDLPEKESIRVLSHLFPGKSRYAHTFNRGYQIPAIRTSSNLNIESIAIGFCGTIYYGLRIEVRSYFRDLYKSDTLFIYNKDDVNGVFDRIFGDEFGLKENTKTIYGRYRQTNESLSKTCRKYFDELTVSTFDPMFIDSPIFLICGANDYFIQPVDERDVGYHKVVINPMLSEFEFFRVKDPFTCFMELDMYVSGVLGGKSPVMVEISDKDMIAKKGFNKYSFRKDPEK